MEKKKEGVRKHLNMASTKVPGKEILNMVMEKNGLSLEPFLKEIGKREEKMEGALEK